MDIERLLAYDRLGRTHWWLTSKYSVLQDVLYAQVPDKTSLSPMLDIGCAGGAFLERFGATVMRKFGVDRDHRILAATKPESVTTVTADVMRLPFRNGVFSLVSAVDIIEHLDDDLGALREMHRILDPNGWLLICVPAFMALFGKHDELFGHLRRYTRKQLTKQLHAADFIVKKATYIQPLFFLPLWVKRRFFPPSNDVFGDFREPGRAGVVLDRLLALERFPLRYVSFPIGSTLIALCRRE